MAEFEIVAAHTRPPADLHAAFLGAFSDYVTGPVHVPFDQWPALSARQGVVESLSRIAVRDGEVIAFGLTCPRPETGRWRLGAMGALPAARGTGAAQALLDDFVDRAKAAGVAEAELECFAANERALRLYRSRGFEVMDDLNAWKATGAPLHAPTRDVRPLERASAFAWPGLADADALANALRAVHADAVAPPLLPDRLGGAALGRAGFERQPLGQVFMLRTL
jgi:ribosomal protein S18 acetylase RimI-like enzyme